MPATGTFKPTEAKILCQRPPVLATPSTKLCDGRDVQSEQGGGEKRAVQSLTEKWSTRKEGTQSEN